MFRTPNAASQMRVAFSSIVWNTGFNSPRDRLITSRTREVAESCSNASSRWRVSSATLVSWLTADAPRPRTTFGALGLLGFVVTRLRFFMTWPVAPDFHARLSDSRSTENTEILSPLRGRPRFTARHRIRSNARSGRGSEWPAQLSREADCMLQLGHLLPSHPDPDPDRCPLCPHERK